MYSKPRDNVFDFPETTTVLYEMPQRDRFSERAAGYTSNFPTMPNLDWRLEVMANAPKLCGGALIFFMVLFGGSLLIANSSDDLRAIRGRALENSSTALLGLSAMGAGAWWLKGKQTR